MVAGLAGRRGRALRQVAGDALAEHMLSEKKEELMEEDSFGVRQRSRREKYLKTIRGLQMKRFGEKSALSFTALVAALSITCRVSFRAALKAFRFSASRRFSNARP